jgi:anaerobic magnesium-protoporphyrin IX monomethyl ester cyclase
MQDVLLVDLNNFARYPTLAIGMLSATLRRAGRSVGVFAPLMVGVHGVQRERRPHVLGALTAQLNYRAATSDLPLVRHLRERAARRRSSGMTMHENQVFDGFVQAFERSGARLVMISTYLMYRSLCERLCAWCKVRGVPVVVGGPYFAHQGVIDDWLRIDGLSALIAGEVELDLPRIVDALLRGNDASVLSGITGVMARGSDGSVRGTIAPPLTRLDAVPWPDYSDFPWSLYPDRIVPIVTGRGCGWGVCTFCSDVTSSAGRTFRSRSPDDVLGEVARHHREHGAGQFVFVDLKLNSNLDMWRALCGRMQDAAPLSRWVGAVHVGREADNGLSLDDLRAAAASGCVRLTTGLESGSQRVADAMKKGTRLEGISAFLHDAHGAGISCRTTMVLGYPGETADDLRASADFLDRHAGVIERVSVNRLQLIAGTPLHRQARAKPGAQPRWRIVSEHAASAQAQHRNDEVHTRAHRAAALRLLAVAHRINRQPIKAHARVFEGVM